MAETPRAGTLGLRPTAEVLARLDALAESATEQTGIATRRGGVAMAALLAGIEVLEARQPKRKSKVGGK